MHPRPPHTFHFPFALLSSLRDVYLEDCVYIKLFFEISGGNKGTNKHTHIPAPDLQPCVISQYPLSTYFMVYQETLNKGEVSETGNQGWVGSYCLRSPRQHNWVLFLLSGGAREKQDRTSVNFSFLFPLRSTSKKSLKTRILFWVFTSPSVPTLTSLTVSTARICNCQPVSLGF